MASHPMGPAIGPALVGAGHVENELRSSAQSIANILVAAKGKITQHGGAVAFEN
jgi:hypothetical protein